MRKDAEKTALKAHELEHVHIDATCVAGVDKDVCKVCKGEFNVEILPEIAGAHKFDEVVLTDATCVKIGRKLNICEYFGLKTVPLIPAEVKFDFKVEDNIDKTVEDLLNYVDGIKYRTYFKDASPNQIAEGLVFRMNDMTNSFKVVSNKFLLKGGE